MPSRLSSRLLFAKINLWLETAKYKKKITAVNINSLTRVHAHVLSNLMMIEKCTKREEKKLLKTRKIFGRPFHETFGHDGWHVIAY